MRLLFRLMPSFGRRGLWLALLVPLLNFSWPERGWGQAPPYTWTMIVPENDTRPSDVRDYDELTSRLVVASMNRTEKIFHRRLTWQRLPISKLLSVPAPFCEFAFDAVNPLILTTEEKAVLKEYLDRGGFIVVEQDVYPYTKEEFRAVKKCPTIDYLIKEIPAMDPNYKVEKITEDHPIFSQHHLTRIPEPERRELQENPASTDYTLVTRQGHPCLFVYANYVCNEHEMVTLARPFGGTFPVPEDYALSVNLYIYVTMH